MTRDFLKKEIIKFEPFKISECDENIRETVVNRMKHCLGMDRKKHITGMEEHFINLTEIILRQDRTIRGRL